ELAWGARNRSAMGEHHGPRNVGGPAPQFTIDEIGDAAEKQSDRRYGCSYVAERQYRNAAMERKQHDGENAAGYAAMERHAAIPELQNFKRIGGEMSKIVEQHITNPAAENDAERDPDDEVVEIGHGERGRAAPQLLRRNNCARIIPAADNADDIGKRVPAYRKRADRNQDRIDRGKRNDREDQHKLFLDLDFLTRAARRSIAVIHTVSLRL